MHYDHKNLKWWPPKQWAERHASAAVALVPLTGLNLAVNQAIVVECAVALTVEGEPGQRSRFHIDLPVGTSSVYDSGKQDEYEGGTP
jgi:hypothetical protein